jgi:putative ABC transport system permease protein
MNLAFDLKYASRLLRKSWGYALLCAGVVTLSLGLSIWAWVLSEDQMLRPLGLPDSETWYNVQITADATTPPQPVSVDAYTYQQLLGNNRSADHLGAYASKRVVLSEGQASTNLRAALISPRLVANVAPLRGRTFQEADAQPGAPAMAIISFDTWQNYFAADPAIIGKTARMDSAPVQIIGVMPKEFYAFADFELWLPLRMTPLARPGDSTLILSPFVVPKGRNLQAVLNEMKSVVTRVNKDYPDLFNPGRHVLLIPGHRMFSSNGTPILVMMMCIAASVLLLGGVNISFVFLARLLERSRELALRTAVGSSRARLLTQCLLETALIVLVGLAAGYGLAAAAIRWVAHGRDAFAQTLAGGRFPAMTALKPGHFITGVCFAIVIWLVSTLFPAWRISRQDAAAVLAGSGKGSSTGSGGRNRGASMLVGLQVTVSCFVLVVCATMMLAVREEVSKPTGLDSARVLVTTSPTVLSARFSEPAQRLQYWEQLTAAIESRMPGVGVAFASAPPTRPAKVPALIETQQGAEKRGAFTLPVAVVSENYFELLGLKRRSGRLFDRTDNDGSLDVAVVDEKLAARYWPGQDVIGKRVRLNPSDNGPWLTIVGVVSAVGSSPYAKDKVGLVYQPLRQAAPSGFHLLARLPGTAADSRTALRAAAFAVDRDLPLNNLQMLDDYLAALEASYRDMIPVLTVIAFITALIAASGLFGLISRSVAQRTQEVGIRRALGATPWRATSIFLRQGAWYLSTAFVGVALAIMLLPPLSQVITNVLNYSVPVAVGVVFFMGLVIFVASYLPSRRAVALEPGDALRYE